MDSRSRANSRRLRAKLILAGHTYRSFAQEMKVSEHTVKAAVNGARNGSKAQRVVAAIKTLPHGS